MRGERQARFWLVSLLVFSAFFAMISAANLGFGQTLAERNVTVTLISPTIQAARTSVSTADGYAIADTSDSPAVSQLIGNIFRGDRLVNAKSGAGYLSTTQSLLGNRAYLTFTRGQRANLISRLPLLKDGSFENFVNPSFAYPVERDSRITISLSYQNIQINGSERLPPGTYSLSIRNAGVSDNKVLVNVARR